VPTTMCLARVGMATEYSPLNTEYFPPHVCKSNDDKIIGGLLHLFRWNPAGMILL
jgi:hypothetical protein